MADLKLSLEQRGQKLFLRHGASTGLVETRGDVWCVSQRVCWVACSFVSLQGHVSFFFEHQGKPNGPTPVSVGGTQGFPESS